MTYYLQRVGDRRWEEVDEYIYRNLVRVVSPDDGRRYNGNYIRRGDNGHLDVHLAEVTDADMSIVARILGVKPDPNAFSNSGFLKTPELLKIALPQGRTVLYNPVTGEKWKKAA